MAFTRTFDEKHPWRCQSCGMMLRDSSCQWDTRETHDCVAYLRSLVDKLALHLDVDLETT
jgi:hypothetical protein